MGGGLSKETPSRETLQKMSMSTLTGHIQASLDESDPDFLEYKVFGESTCFDITAGILDYLQQQRDNGDSSNMKRVEELKDFYARIQEEGGKSHRSMCEGFDKAEGCESMEGYCEWSWQMNLLPTIHEDHPFWVQQHLEEHDEDGFIDPDYEIRIPLKVLVTRIVAYLNGTTPDE